MPRSITSAPSRARQRHQREAVGIDDLRRARARCRAAPVRRRSPSTATFGPAMHRQRRMVHRRRQRQVAVGQPAALARAARRPARNRGRRGGCAGRAAAASSTMTRVAVARRCSPGSRSCRRRRGTTPPVKMRAASPGPTVPSNGWPAATSPITFSVAGRRRDVGRAHRIAVHGRHIGGRLGAQRRDDRPPARGRARLRAARRSAGSG